VRAGAGEHQGDLLGDLILGSRGVAGLQPVPGRRDARERQRARVRIAQPLGERDRVIGMRLCAPPPVALYRSLDR
jgi:hypothetical protein